jgi:branched-chain amino acid transport system ATP-binding protein
MLPALLRLPRIVQGDAKCREFAAELMESVGLGDYIDAEASMLPYGALKRLEIARALATRPKMLLLDEPAAGLNPAETDAIDRLIKGIAESGVTVLLVEHDMRLVMGISDRVLVLDQGRWLASGTTAEIRRDPKVVAAYLGEEARDR